jgi:probable addiction module antidote protein
MPKRTRSFKAGQLERLKNPRYAAQYVNAAIEGGDNAALLLALRNVAEAQSVTTVARDAGVSRENVYRMLSETGNPCYTSLQGILGALGLRFNIQPVPQQPSEGARSYACSYASTYYSPLVWEVSDRPHGCFSHKFEGFTKGFYRRADDQISRRLQASATHTKHPGELLDLELVA